MRGLRAKQLREAVYGIPVEDSADKDTTAYVVFIRRRMYKMSKDAVTAGDNPIAVIGQIKQLLPFLVTAFKNNQANKVTPKEA